MTEEIKEIPKELQLEQNKFIQSLFKQLLVLQNKVKMFENNQGNPNPEGPKNYNDKQENIRRYGDDFRNQIMTTRRDIRLINGEGKVCCFFCDGTIKGSWRQVINLEACDPDCAAQLEGIFSSSVYNYKIGSDKQNKK